MHSCVKHVSYAIQAVRFCFGWHCEGQSSGKCKEGGDDLIPVSDNSQPANDGNREGVPERFESDG